MSHGERPTGMQRSARRFISLGVSSAVALVLAFLSAPGGRAAGPVAVTWGLQVSDLARQATKQTLASGHYQTIPFFASSFAYHGRTYQYQMVGTAPSRSGTTRVPVAIVPVDVTLEGNHTLSISPYLSRILRSPLFEPVRWKATGDRTQYVDALRRAGFWRMERQRSGYHLLLEPRMLDAVHLSVPAGVGVERTLPHGIPFGLVDSTWWTNQISRLMGTLPVTSREMTLFVTYDLLAVGGKIRAEAGFHAAALGRAPGGARGIYTYGWASWGAYGAATSFGYPASFAADVMGLGHELGEWSNDPFGLNVVPKWSYSIPPLVRNACSNLLETADPLALAGFTVQHGGFTYHLQDQAFLSWFARQSPSEGYQGRYSFLGRLSGSPPACR